MPAMRLDAIGVASSDLALSAEFYGLLGFTFAPVTDDMQHLEAQTPPGEVRLMIDRADLVRKLTGTDPTPASHSAFAMLCSDPAAVDAAADAIAAAGFAVITPPWDAFWGQRYATVADPDGTLIDLFAPL